MLNWTPLRGLRAHVRRLLALMLFTGLASGAVAAAPANPGFELGPPGTAAPGWTLSAVELARVTDGDDGSDYEVYLEYGISVPPLRERQSLILGRPDVARGQQQRGHNRATTDVFTAIGDTLSFSIRAFSFEGRSDDSLQFRVLDPAGGLDLDGVHWQFTPDPERPGNLPLEAVTTLCGAGPECILVIDIGRNNADLFDSGVLEVEVSGLPVGEPIQLDVSVFTGENSAKATWMYLDDAQAPPPEPAIRVNPGDTPDLPALEGDFVVADCLESVGIGLSCEWTATGGGWATPRTASGDIAFFWFPDDQPVTIELTVTAEDGQTASVSRPLYLINAEPAVNAVNVEVLPGDEGAETVCRFADAGIGSYDDEGLIPGTEEIHTLLSGTPIDWAQESQPSFSSGFFRISAGDGTCVVSDGSAFGSDPFLVQEIDPLTLATRLGDETRSGGTGGNDTIETAHTLAVDWKYLATIADPQDIDVYRIVGTDGHPLSPGSELVVTLTGQPADYDLLVFSNGGSTEASPFFNAPFFNAPFFNAPFFNAPFFNAPFFNAQFNSVPFFNAPFFNAPFFNAPFFNAPVKKSPFFNAGDPSQVFNRAFTELPLSEVGLAAPDGSNVSGSDISVSEVGSLSLRSLQASPGISLKALSAEPGLGQEQVLVKVAPGETEIYVAVVGNDLAFSANQPYGLTLEASTPPSQKALLEGTGFCAPEADSSGNPLYGPSWSAAASGDPAAGTVLILTQRERYEIEQAAVAAAAVNAGEAASVPLFWTDFWAKIDEYASAVGGTVVSIDGSLYQAADMDPCSVATRNTLAEAIRTTYIVDAESGVFRNANLSSVVIVGGQNIVPSLAVPDETVVGNEKDFTTDLWVRPGTPLAVATAEGYNLTDAFLTDLSSTPFRGRALYLEDRPVGRLVEKPQEISGDLDAFFAIQAGTAPNSGRLAYGYDFFCDGTSEVADLLGADVSDVGPPCSSSLPWTASDLARDWLGGGAPMCTESAATLPLEIANVNAHMTTYGLLSAAGFLDGLATGNYDDVLPASAAAACLNGTLTVTIGCHSGLNIPDGWAIGSELGLPFDAARDWVEALGFMVAPRGYGLGDNTVSNRGTEGIMILLVDELNAGRTLGQALVNAKRRYVMGLRELDVHDEDSLINLALFAPPQLVFPAAGMAALNAAYGTQASNAVTEPVGSLALTVTEGNADGTESYLVGSASGPALYDLIRYDDVNLRGSWFEIFPGDAQATYGRTLQPVTLPFENRPLADAPDQTRVHGVAMVSRVPVSPCPIDDRDSACYIAANYSDLGGPDLQGLYSFDPVLPLPQHDWVVYEDDLSTDSGLEPFSCVEALVPTQLGVASTLDTGESVRQSLVVGAGQFRCEGALSIETVLGQQRLYSALSLAATHPVGNSTAEARAIDNDFDPPQVTVQSVIADPASGNVTATVQATDALTGGNGIREIIALVYWNEDDNASGTGVVESYSIRPEGALTAEPFGHTFVLENARDQRLAFQYIDGAGNLTVKSQKGTLIEAVDVNIIDAEIDIAGTSSVTLSIGDYCLLQSPVLSYSINGNLVESFAVNNPPAGITVTLDQSGGCDVVISLDGIVFPITEYGQSAELTIEIRAIGAVGSDTEEVFAPDVLEIQLPLLPSGTVGMFYPDQTFTATGGVGGYTFAITAGSLPANLTFTQNEGETSAVISGSLNEFAGSPYEFTVTVTDAGGVSTSQTLSLEVYPPPIVIGTTAIPSGRVGDNYEATLTATGGSGNGTWQLAPGSTLPDGLTLETVDAVTGRISGTPLAFTSGPASLTIVLEDPDPNVASISVTLTLEIAPAALNIAPLALPEGMVGAVYPSQSLTVSGGSGTGSWSLDGALPPGISLSGSGLISGTPTDFAGSPYAFTAIYTDADARVEAASIDLQIVIEPAPLVIETTVLPDGVRYELYSETLEADGGRGNYLWTLVSGQLPRGLSLSGDGTISGRAERKESTTFTARVSDGTVQTSREFSITIAQRSCDDGDPNHDHPQDCVDNN